MACTENESQLYNLLIEVPAFAGMLAPLALCFKPSLADLVVFAGSLNPIPSRTRPLNSPAPMVLSLKAWKSRSLPGLPRTGYPHHDVDCILKPPLGAASSSPAPAKGTRFICGAALRK